MKKIFIIMFLLVSCSRIDYQYKDVTTLNNQNLYNSGGWGVAIYGHNISEIYNTVIKDIKKFSNSKKQFYDISNELRLDSKRIEIQNIVNLKSHFPDINYVIVVHQKQPMIKKEHGYDSEYRGNKRYDYEYYRTVFSVTCETIFFDIEQNKLIAKSTDTFSEISEKKFRDLFDHTSLSFLEDLFSFFSKKPEKIADNKYFPNIENVEGKKLEGYFLKFLYNLQ